MFRVFVPARMRAVVLVFLPLFAFIFIGCAADILYPTFSHQGKLLDSSGDPVADGSYTVMYRLYHDATGGTAVYTDTNSVTITDGYFNSDFGAVGVDPKIFAQRTWLEITINGETLTPRQFLRGAPYASGLVAGSAAIGSQPITYTYSTYDNLGSAFFAANTDFSAKGGSGLTAITTAQIPAGPDRLDVAAVRGISIDRDNSAATGTYAGIFVSEDFRGLYAKGRSGDYAAWFAGDIYVNGSCTGCNMALVAQNTGKTTIAPGDFVTALGVEVDPDYGMPILLVRKAAAGDVILGVAESAMDRGEYYEDTLAQLGYEKTAGAIEQAGYVSVVTEGLVQARLPQTAPLKTGDFITMAGNGVDTTSNINESIAQVMSGADETGLQWILLNR